MKTIANARVISFPRALVFQAFCEAEHLARWWGPNDFTNTFTVFEPVAGGSWGFVLTVSLEDRGGETSVLWEQEFESAEMRDKVLAFVPTANEENLDRLEAELRKMTA